MMTQDSGATLEKIDRIYYCANCKTVYLFKSEVEDHTASHSGCKIDEMPFE